MRDAPCAHAESRRTEATQSSYATISYTRDIMPGAGPPELIASRRSARRRLIAAFVAVAIAGGVSAAAGQFGGRGGRRGFQPGAAMFATPDSFDGGFQFCRIV